MRKTLIIILFITLLSSCMKKELTVNEYEKEFYDILLLDANNDTFQAIRELKKLLKYNNYPKIRENGLDIELHYELALLYDKVALNDQYQLHIEESLKLNYYKAYRAKINQLFLEKELTLVKEYIDEARSIDDNSKDLIDFRIYIIIRNIEYYINLKEKDNTVKYISELFEYLEKIYITTDSKDISILYSSLYYHAFFNKDILIYKPDIYEKLYYSINSDNQQFLDSIREESLYNHTLSKFQKSLIYTGKYNRLFNFDLKNEDNRINISNLF